MTEWYTHCYFSNICHTFVICWRHNFPSFLGMFFYQNKTTYSIKNIRWSDLHKMFVNKSCINLMSRIEFFFERETNFRLSIVCSCYAWSNCRAKKREANTSMWEDRSRWEVNKTNVVSKLLQCGNEGQGQRFICQRSRSIGLPYEDDKQNLIRVKYAIPTFNAF